MKKVIYKLWFFIFIPSLALAEKINEFQPPQGYTLKDFIVNNFINYILGFSSALAVLFIAIGGIQYMTSGGDEKRTAVAKKTLTYAIIGLVLVILALVIVNVIQNQAVEFVK
ncbi:MAG: pilin [Patescibacteria group bacterium]|nr:pilin [Patescibacteria group bacterium]MCL5093712.1 pilin [Patescibacteria group bacterium]